MVFGGESDFTASEEASFAMLDHYVEQGSNFIDTANILNHAQSRQAKPGGSASIPDRPR